MRAGGLDLTAWRAGFLRPHLTRRLFPQIDQHPATLPRPDLAGEHDPVADNLALQDLRRTVREAWKTWDTSHHRPHSDAEQFAFQQRLFAITSPRTFFYGMP